MGPPAGRLHAAERLIDIVYDAARAESAMITAAEVNALKRRAFLAILDAEKPHLGRSADLIAALREEIGAAVPAEPAPEPSPQSSPEPSDSAKE
ncbi:MAG: hypothetical protein P8Z76_17270 [Alphaproteobacteria bacterium]